MTITGPSHTSGSIGRALALAICLAFSLTGCIKSHGPLLPVADASTPLPPGRYFSVSRLNATAGLPALRRPVRVQRKGNSYSATLSEPNERPLRFHLIRVPDADDVYILQTDADDERGYRDILIGVVGKHGFCSKDIKNFPPDAVADGDIVSGPILLRWLADKATEIRLMANDVCFLRII